MLRCWAIPQLMRKASKSLPNGLRLLLIDDNSRGLLARKVVLEEQGYTVVTSCRPEDAIEKFASEPFDLVVTDYRMPGMNGDELLRRLREIRHVPAVLISGMVEVLGLNEHNTGADAVVAKNVHELTNMVRAVERLSVRPVRKPAGSHGRSSKVNKAAGE